jgi:hypothetical protein
MKPKFPIAFVAFLAILVFFAGATLVNLTNQVTGTLPHGNGGTDVTSPGSAGNVLRSNGSSWASAALAHSDLSGSSTCAQQPALTGDTTSSAGSCSTTVTDTRSFGTTFGDTTGSALTSGSIVYFRVPYSCTIAGWAITVDGGTVTFDIWKIASGSAIPTVSNTITASAKPALSSGTALVSTTLTGWTTSVSADDIFGIQLNTVATAKYAEIDLKCTQTHIN